MTNRHGRVEQVILEYSWNHPSRLVLSRQEHRPFRNSSPLQKIDQCRQLQRYGFPNNFPVDAIIRVDEPIAHSRDFFPRYF